MAGGIVSAPATRDRPPDIDDQGLVVRPIGPIGPIIWGDGTLQNGAQTAVGAIAVIVLPADPNRKASIIQNVGTENIRIGAAGVTSTTGIQLVPGATAIFEAPYIVGTAQDIWAIQESAPSIAFATEIT